MDLVLLHLLTTGANGQCLNLVTRPHSRAHLPPICAELSQMAVHHPTIRMRTVLEYRNIASLSMVVLSLLNRLNMVDLSLASYSSTPAGAARLVRP